MSTTVRKTLYRGASIIALLLLAAGVMPKAYADPNGPNAHSHRVVYEITRLPSLGGDSRGSGINLLGKVVGFSDVADSDVRHATLWVGGKLIDLGTLGDGDDLSSSVVWPGLNLFGTVAGISQIDDLDPLGQEFSCGLGGFLPNTGHKCRGFAWRAGEMKGMPTLGGHNSFATAVNNRGQVVGWAETDFEDPSCDEDATQVLQFLGVIWNPRTDELEILPPLPGHSASTGNAINDRGQVVGISGDCDQAVGRDSALSAVLWDRGETIDLGNLGGDNWHTPIDINRKGDVAGFSTTEEDRIHAFLWTRADGIQDLGVLEDDHIQSQASGINRWRQVVGLSVPPTFPDDELVAFLWQDGEMLDLNSLAPGFADHLATAQHIDIFGRITGRAVDAESGESYAYIATPRLQLPW